MKRNTELWSVSGVLLILLLGKFLSLAANQAYLSYFGADNEHLNIFSWALQVPGHLFQSVGTALVSVVIPVYAALRANGKPGEAARFSSNLLGAGALLAALICALGLVLSFFLPGLTEFSDKSYAALCLRLAMPAVLCYGLTYIMQGLLQSHGRYAAAAAVNLPGGLLILAYLALFAGRFGVTGLLVTVLIGLAVQVVMLWLPARRAGISCRLRLDLHDGAIRTAGRRSLPVLLGAFAYQLDLFFCHTLMSRVSPASLSLYLFMQTILTGLVAVLTSAVNSVAYPQLAALAAQGETGAFRTALREKLELLFFLFVPLTAALAVLGKPALRLLSLYGKMTETDLQTEYVFLLSGGACLVFFGWKELADRALFALQTTKTSAQANFLILLLNVPLVLLLTPVLGSAAIPLSWALAIIAASFFLLLALRKRLGRFGGLTGALFKTLLAAAAMCAASFGVLRLLSDRLPDTVAGRLLTVGLPALAGLGVYLGAAFALRTPALMRLRKEKT